MSATPPMIGFPVRIIRPAAVPQQQREAEPDLERRLSPKEVADILQVDVHTIYRHIRSGLLSCERVGNRIRITPTDLRCYRTRHAEIQAKAEADADTRGTGRPRKPGGRFARLAHDVTPEGGPTDA